MNGEESGGSFARTTRKAADWDITSSIAGKTGTVHFEKESIESSSRVIWPSSRSRPFGRVLMSQSIDHCSV